MSRSLVRRAGAAVAGGALAAAGLALVAPAPGASAAVDPEPAAAAADWLMGEFATLEVSEAGDAIDFGLAVEATGSGPDLSTITTSLDAVLSTFLPPVDPAPSQWDAINVAMAADYYATVGATPPAESDLFDRLTGMVDDTTGQFGPSAWPYSQTYAVNALRALGSGELTAARTFLLDSQCEGGFWGFDQSCAAFTDDVDGTALAVLALLPDAADPAVQTAIDDAVAWLLTQQRTDGGFGAWGTNTNGTTSSGPSSGLVGWALAGAGAMTEAGQAAEWLRVHQAAAVSGCVRPLDADAGAVAFDDDYYDAAQAGIPGADRGTWQLATAQAYAALTYLPATTSNLTMPVPAFLDGGGTTKLTVTNLRPFERGCVRVGGKRTWFRANASGKAVVTSAVPDRTGFIGVSADTADRGVGTETVVLAAKTLPFERKASVSRGGTQRVAVSGLFSGEKVVVKYDGEVVARGTATTQGTFIAKFGVGRVRGDHKIKVVGQFADRTATKTFTVV